MTVRIDDYEKYKAERAKVAADRSAAGREIGTLPRVANLRRRRRCGKALAVFGLTYFRERFPLALSSSHRTAIGIMERCVRSGGLFCCAMPRTSGKTMWAEVAAVWALLYGYRRFVVLLGATDPLATQSLKRIQEALETNDLLLADFPEVCVPVRALERISNRVKGQTQGGEPTRMEWSSEGIRFPTTRTKHGVSNGSIIHVASVEGAVRGLVRSDAAGRTFRPDLILIDDVQTRASAKSPTQTADREAIVTDDVLGLAGPTTRIAALNLCTPIYIDDLSERFLDKGRHPEWESVRTSMLESFPADMDLWDRYADLLRETLRGGDTAFAAATEFYQQNRAAMDAGAVVSWPDRFKDGAVSAVQYAMNLFYLNPRGFWAEHQCRPTALNVTTDARELVPAEVAARVSGLPRLQVPAEASRLTAMIDIGGLLHWYAVVAWDERFGGSVIDYGTWPRQNRTQFAAADPRPSLADKYPGLTETERVFAGLRDLTAEVLGRTYRRGDDWESRASIVDGKVTEVQGRPYRRSEGGSEVKIDRCLIDASWETDTVAQFVRQSPHAAILYPSQGRARSATNVGVSRWKLRPGERSGLHWKLTTGVTGKGKVVQFDTDHWKSFLWERLTTAAAGRGWVGLWGTDRQHAHAMLADHCAAESATVAEIKGDRFHKWVHKAHRPDNHLWDCLVGAAVAASVEGLVWTAGGGVDRPPAVKRPKVSLAELQAKRRAERERRQPA